MFINELKLGQNLLKRKDKKKRQNKTRPKSSSVTRETGGVITTKDKKRVLLPNPFAFLHCLNAVSAPSTRLTVALERSRATFVEVH